MAEAKDNGKDKAKPVVRRTLYRESQPRDFKEVIGQAGALALLRGYLKNGVPQAILFHGPPGTGKSTLAEIMAAKLDCPHPQFTTFGLAEGHTDTIRRLHSQSAYAPLAGSSSVFILEEVQELGNSRAAQGALLDVIGKPPPGVYFLLCTTDPDRLRKEVGSRCHKVELRRLSSADLTLLVRRLEAAEGVKPPLSDELVEAMVECSEGDGRTITKWLQDMIGVTDPAERLALVCQTGLRRDAFDVLKALLYRKTSWPEMVQILKGLEVARPESFRHYILKSATTELLKGGRNTRAAYELLRVFESSWQDREESGLATACYEFLCLRGS